MRYSENKSFGYPVIKPNGDDFLDAKFNTKVILKLDGEKLIAEVENEVPDFFKELASEKKVKFLTVIRCPFTAFEEHREYFEPNKTLEFNSTDCFNKIEIDSYIVCNEILTVGKEIKKDYINKFYHDLKKPYEKNSVIGFSVPQKYRLEPYFNNISMGSFLFKTSENVPKGCIQYDFGEKQIILYCNTDDELIYKWLQKREGVQKEFYYTLFLNTVLIPALSVAILAYKNGADSCGSWKETLIQELKKFDPPMDNPQSIEENRVSEIASHIIASFEPHNEKGITQLIKNTQTFGARANE